MTDLDRLQEKWEAWLNGDGRYDLDVMDPALTYIAALEQRVRELEDELDGWKQEFDEAEAENERLRWMLEFCIGRLDLRWYLKYPSPDEIRDELESRWTRREEKKNEKG